MAENKGHHSTGNLTTNQKVVFFARGQLGRVVRVPNRPAHEKSQCWDLAERALQKADAKTSNDLGPVEKDSDYVWGELIDIKDVEPGDIIQFRDYIVTTKTEAKYVFQDGSWFTENREASAIRGPQHTAIADGMLDSNGVVRTLDQHVKTKHGVVQNLWLNTRDVPAITTNKKQNQLNKKTKKMETATVSKTVTVTVTGTMWVYKPIPK